VHIYDQLVMNPMKNSFELSHVIERIPSLSQQPATKEPIAILDIGCGTGHHVGLLYAMLEEYNKSRKSDADQKKMKITGLDISPAMVAQAQKNYPEMDAGTFVVGNVEQSNLFPLRAFSHLLCFYFTIYYLKSKDTFFQNCFDWLKPGGYLFLHLVDRDTFDPILPPGNPLFIVSPQRYAKERITRTKIHFKEFEYQSNFQTKTDVAAPSSFFETFKFPDRTLRKQEHLFYMESMDTILNVAQEVGFLVKAKIDLMKVAYDNQFLYLLVKPN
jgi:SAM-dependent methyltransferase